MKLLVPSLLAFSIGVLNVHSQAPSMDPAAIRAQVEALLEKRKETRVKTRDLAIQEIQKRAQSGSTASNFYEEAYRTLTFDGRSSDGKAKMEWSKKNAEMLNSAEFKTAAELNLKYLALTIKRFASDKAMDFVMPSVAYVKELSAANAKYFDQQNKVPKEQKDLLGSPLKDSPIVKVNGLQSMVKESPDWEETPGNIDGIFEKNIFGPLREAKDPRVMDAWDLRLDLATQTANAKKLTIAKQNFDQIQFPNFRFARAEDMLLLGKKNEAISEMFLLLQNYPNHPAFDKWAQTLLRIVSPETPAS